jgi:DNA topoisomerase IB
MLTKDQQIRFLTSLYAVYANSAGMYKKLGESISSSIKDAEAINVWKSVAKASPKEDIRGILMQAAQGKNVELKPLGVALKRFLNESGSDTFAPPVANLTNRFSGYFRTGSQVGANALSKTSSSSVFPSWVRTSFQEKKIDQSKVADSLKSFVKEVTGKPGNGLTVEQANELRSTDKEKYREYLKLRRDFQLSWKNAASNYIREHGNPLVDMKDLLAYLDEQGLEYAIPSGFTGKVDAELRWYDSNGELIGGVPTAHMFPKVRMNTTRKPGEYVFTALPANKGGNEKYFYLVKEIRERRDKKFQAVQDVVPIIGHARKVWLQGIRHFDLNDDKTVAAVAIELSYQFASRIGTEGNQTQGKQTYGLSTARVKHLKFQPNGFTLTYPGKDGIKNSHKYLAKDAESRMVLDAVKQLVDGKEPNDPIFTVGEGDRVKPLRPAVVNMVFRKIIGTKALSIHKLRTLRGTVIFQENVDAFLKANKGAQLTEREAMAQLKKMAIDVGKQLNHVRTAADGEEKVTPDTALKSYIDPSVQIKFFESLGLPLPNYLLKLRGKDRLESNTIAGLYVVAEPTTEELEAELGDDAFVADPSSEEPESSVAEPEPEETPSEDVAEPVEPESLEEEAPSEDEGGNSPEETKEEEPTKPKEEAPPKPTEEEIEKERLKKSRKEAEDNAERESALLRDILVDPDVAEHS